MPRQSDVHVRVEVFVNGKRVTTAKKRALVKARKIKPLAILNPTTTGQIVYQSGGTNYIQANGTSQYSSAGYPSSVYALAYNTPGVDPTDHPTPDAGAVTVGADDDGSWAFNLQDGGPVPPGNAIPGAANGGPNPNSTLLIWYEYDDGSGDPIYTIDSLSFYASLSSSSSSSGGAGSSSSGGAGSSSSSGGGGPGSSSSGGGAGSSSSRGPAISRASRAPASLTVSFAGPLAALGAITLTWNGIKWVGTSSQGGGTLLTMTLHDRIYELSAFGAIAAFVVTPHPSSFKPFRLQGRGTAIGELAGPFTVTITG